MPILDHALALAARGFHVFPVKAGEKAPPLIEDFPNKATRDPATVRQWWTRWPHANVAISTSRFGDDRHLLVVDADARKGGLATLMTLDSLPATCTQTTPGGGVHLLFVTAAPVRQGADVLGPGLDIRAQGGYVLAHGSTVAGGRGYVMDATRLADAPAWLVDRLAIRPPAPVVPVARAPLGPLDTNAAVARAIAYLMDDAPAAVEGAHGDDTTYRVACHVKDIGISEPTCAALMLGHWNGRCRPPWSDTDLRAKVAHAFRYGANPPGSAAPENQFAPVPAVAGNETAAPVVARRRGKHGDDWRTGATWLLKDLLPARGVAAIVGPSGSGKSLLALHLARQLATSEPFFSTAPKARAGTIILACEGSGTMAARLAALPPAPDGKPMPIYWVEAGNLANRDMRIALIGELRAIAEEMKRDFGISPGLLVIDTWRASGLLHGENSENDNAVVAAAVRAVDEVAGAIGALALVLHHPRKSGDSEAGAGAFRAALDAMLWIERDGRDAIRSVRLDKSRDAGEREVGTFNVRQVTLGADEDGEIVASATVDTTPATDDAAHGGRVHRFVPALVDAVKAAMADTNGEPVDERTVRVAFDVALPADSRADNRKRTFDRCLRDALRLRLVHRIAIRGRVKLTTEPAVSAQRDFSPCDTASARPP